MPLGRSTTTHERRGFITSKGNPLTLLGPAVQVGSKAPGFTSLRADLTPFSLADAAGEVLVISSVPSLDTAVCVAQARRFNQEAATLGGSVKVLVISMDPPFPQKRFCTTEGIANLETLSDHRDAAFGTAYGLLIKESRLLARGVLLIDRDGGASLPAAGARGGPGARLRRSPGGDQKAPLTLSAVMRISPRPTSWPSPVQTSTR